MTHDEDLDPAVAFTLQQANRRASNRADPLAVQQRRVKERERRAQRNTVSYDLPVELDRALDELARANSIPVSDLARFLLERALADPSTPAALQAQIQPSRRSLKFDNRLF